MYKYFLIFLPFCLLSSCQHKMPGSFYEGYIQAKQTNKYLWLNLGYGNNLPISDQIEKIKTSGKAIKEDFILQQCDLLDTSNTFLSYIFLPENTNNSYLFNPKGEVISFSFHKITAESIRDQIKAIQNHRPQLPKRTREFVSTPVPHFTG